MCGIAGIAAFEGDEPGQRALVEAMIAEIWHRGPDGGGVAPHRDATLGMRRLAIVDVAGGQQPMFNDDGSIVIVYNGEVYNAPELRERLTKRGVRFKTRSDTEVVLRLYEQDPEQVEEHLVGMWAFAIHDRKRRRLVLSRDRFGIKPLFLVGSGRSLGFGSELRALMPLKARRGFAEQFKLDAEAAHAMLAWKYVPEGDTIYSGVRRLEPATRLELDLASGKSHERRYWELKPARIATNVVTFEEACALVEPLLRRAVREHLESDVPVASFLSGGIDSSLVTALAAEQSTRPIVAYTIGFKEPRFDEATFAADVAKRMGVEHQVTYLTVEDARDAVADALLAYDEPFGDSSAIATFLLAKTVRKQHKVALAGDGGDEVFAGYRKHRIVQVRKALQGTPLVQRAMHAALARLPARTDRTSTWSDLLRTAARVGRGLERSAADAYVALTQVVPLSSVAQFLVQPSTGEKYIEQARDRFNRTEGSELWRTLGGDLTSPLANDMLTKVDRATMAVSLEARVPFLDHRVVEVGTALPARFSLGYLSKRVLRELHEKRFGEALARRGKMGFGVPVESWLRTTLAASADQLFSTRRLDRYGLLSSRTLSEGRWRVWAESDPQALWHVFSLAVWCEATLGDGPDAVHELLGRKPGARAAPRREISA